MSYAVYFGRHGHACPRLISDLAGTTHVTVAARTPASALVKQAAHALINSNAALAAGHGGRGKRCSTWSLPVAPDAMPATAIAFGGSPRQVSAAVDA